MIRRCHFGAIELAAKLAAALGIVLFFAVVSRAGGPARIAGTSYFDPAMTGVPLVWAQGQVVYFTDQGDLSPILPNSSANTFVAEAFSQWTSVPTAALAITSGGQLAEDVTGANLTLSPNGIITGPADITPIATGTPLGMVYDYDGSVTDDLLGAGAGDASQCFTNAVFGGADNFGIEANFQHALVVINGQCALETSQLPDVEYRLVRVLGNVLGLGWSQLNLNVVTGNPPPTAADYAGFPVMHFKDLLSCVPITRCYANPYELAMDDVAAISRLYPVTAQNQTNFPGSQIFSATTARIYGSVWFTDSSGNAAQPMQGVNVIARWIDPSTGLASGQYAVSSVSGFLFAGDAGNPITGTSDPIGNPYSLWGSNDPAVEGFFDLGGLQLPHGTSSAQYQLSVEALDPNWSLGVGPYAPTQVAPSGAMQPIVVTVSAGVDAEQDILMIGSAQPVPVWAPSQTWPAPAAVPVAGDWLGSLSPYGDAAYFSIAAQANRTLSIAVTSLDESGVASENKAQPVIGMWASSDTQGTRPGAWTPAPFNSIAAGLTRLDAQIVIPTKFLIGISDMRGDGRPDYHYHAHVLYGDSVSPARMSVAGGTVTVSGIGFMPGLTAAIGNNNVAPVAFSAGEMVLSVPAQADGVETLTITDPVTGSFSTLSNALTFGASNTDNIVLVAGSNPSTPVGTQAAHPIIVRVVAADGVTPVSGATVGWSATNSTLLSACGAAACSAVTDQGGEALTWATPQAAGTVTITATLAPGVYSSSPSVSAQFVATSSSSEIGLLMPYLWIAQGANFSLPLTAAVLSNGVAQNGATVNFRITSGNGSLSAASALTNSSGSAAVTLTLTNFSGALQGSACVGQSNNPCQNFYVNSVAISALNLQPVAGNEQSIGFGQSFQPVTVRVTDSSSPPNAVAGATVAFLTTVLRPAENSSPGNPVVPVILSVNQNDVESDVNGLASLQPSAGTLGPPLEVVVGAAAGNASLQYELQVLDRLPPLNGNAPPRRVSPPVTIPPPRRELRMIWPADVTD
jgi:hypothetical protein